MASTVTAATGDTPCGLALQHGFTDCAALRAEGANSAFLNRPLQAGDRVTLPNLTPKSVNAAARR